MTEKRSCERIPVQVDVKFCFSSHCQEGRIVNISEKGMFVGLTGMCFPIDPNLEIMVPLKGEELKIPVILRRIEMAPDSCDGIGVEIRQPQAEYLEFVKSLRNAIQK